MGEVRCGRSSLTPYVARPSTISKGLFETGSLTDELLYRNLSAQLDLLGRKFNVFIGGVEREHRTP